MRTIKRKALPLNKNKEIQLEKLCRAFSREKQYWLDMLKNWKFQALLGTPRKIRDEFVDQKYKSIYGLQARHWKLALQDAVETWDKYWKALFLRVRSKISQCKDMSNEELHYAFWLLKGYPQFAELMQGQEPQPNFDIEKTSLHRTACFVRRIVKKLKGKQPGVKKARVCKFDANCYEVFEHNGNQYIKLMSLEPGKRLVIPLLGKTKMEGNLTIILSKEGNLEVHATQELKLHAQTHNDSIEAIDFGYSEVMTDTQGNRYGKQFGELLTKASNNRHEKMQKRHKLHALEKKFRKSNPRKAANCRKYNLGRKKLNDTAIKAKGSMECEINTAINELIETKNPSILITEDLRHLFNYNKSRSVNRKLSSWLRGKLQDRVAFKALAEGFRHEQVNPAYGSQVCPSCEFVDQGNRKMDRFKCLYCGHEDLSDRVAALNYVRRYGDEEIGLYMPYGQVKTILLSRFQRRLETGQPVTVPGRTLDTVPGVDPPPSVETMQIAITGREKISRDQAVNQRAKQNKHV